MKNFVLELLKKPITILCILFVIMFFTMTHYRAKSAKLELQVADLSYKNDELNKQNKDLFAQLSEKGIDASVNHANIQGKIFGSAK